MTDTTIGSWCGRTLRVIHAAGRKARWRLETSPGMKRPYLAFRGWLREAWPELTHFTYSLNLAQERKLAAAVAKLIHRCDDAGRAAVWLNEVAQLAPEWRLLFVEAVIPHAAMEVPPMELLREARGVAGYRETLGEWLDAVAKGVPEALARESVRYGRAMQIGLDWDAASAASWFDAGRAGELVERAKAHGDDQLCRQLWRAMVRRREAKRIFSSSTWETLDAPSARRFLELAIYEMRFEHKTELALENKLARVLAFYRGLSDEDQARARAIGDRLFQKLPVVWPVMERLPAAVVPEEVPFHYVLDPYTELPTGEKRRFAEAPAQSFEILLKALRRRNECELVLQGLTTLFRSMPRLAVDVFRLAPKHLMHLAKLAGALHENHATGLIRGWSGHELCTAEIGEGDVVALDNLLTRHVTLARRLRRFHEWELHFSGRKLMPLTGVKLAFEELRAQVALLAAWQMEDAVKAQLAWDPHTFAMLRQSEKNRRLLRRFLREPGLGFIDRHPATRAWRESYPQVDVARWRRGVVLQRDGVRLALERDPVEVLKMGTYVGSCVGLGGHNQFNAATVVLDVNKQVVFARDAAGKFLARQLLAISEAGKLVCFPVYAVGDYRLWQPLFAEYARALAWSVGLTIQTGYSYYIPQVIARAWYDDGSWDLVSEEERVAA